MVPSLEDDELKALHIPPLTIIRTNLEELYDLRPDVVVGVS